MNSGWPCKARVWSPTANAAFEAERARRQQARAGGQCLYLVLMACQQTELAQRGMHPGLVPHRRPGVNADTPSVWRSADGAAQRLGDQLMSEADADGSGVGVVKFAHEPEQSCYPRLVVVDAGAAPGNEKTVAVRDLAGIAPAANIEELECGLLFHAVQKGVREHGRVVAELGAVLGIHPVGLEDADMHQMISK